MLTAKEALAKVELLLRDRLSPASVPYAVECVEDVRQAEAVPGPSPAELSEWVTAKQNSPSRAPYTDQELIALRYEYDPNVLPVSSREAVVIWTLLDMLETQKGWRP